MAGPMYGGTITPCIPGRIEVFSKPRGATVLQRAASRAQAVGNGLR